jgi:hypothetical protein
MNKKYKKLIFYSVFYPVKTFTILFSIVVFIIFLAFKVGQQGVGILDDLCDSINRDRR